MAYVTPGTVAAGDVATAAAWNVLVGNDVAFSPIVGAFTSYTPSVTSITVGNGTLAGKYLQVGKLVLISIRFILGSTSSITGSPTFSLPVSNSYTNSVSVFFDNTGVAAIPGVAQITGSTLYIYAINSASTYASGANISSTVPHTWKTNDSININAFYETT